MSDFREGVSNHGKWSVAGVPHKGWECVDTYDSGEDGEELTRVCEMCEQQPIRFVHVMQHPDYPGQLECGCVCAGRIEENKIGARLREKAMRSLAGRRLRFPDHAGWRWSQKGNPYINSRGFHVVVFSRGNGFGVNVTPPDRPVVRGTKTFPTERAAQLAAFDWMEKDK